MSNQTDKLKIREDDTPEQTAGDSLLKRLIRENHLSFARFYLEHSGAEPPLTDEQIYAMWQEKSREK